METSVSSPSADGATIAPTTSTSATQPQKPQPQNNRWTTTIYSTSSAPDSPSSPRSDNESSNSSSNSNNTAGSSSPPPTNNNNKTIFKQQQQQPIFAGLSSSTGSVKKKNLSSHRYRKSSLSNEQKKSERRGNILREILTTEQAYISFLQVLVDVYLVKIREKEIISNNDIELIFSNIESIKSANDEILAKFKEKIENRPNFPQGVEIADIFIENGPFLKIYSIFVNNYYNKAIQIIKNQTLSNKKFKSYLTECKNIPFSKKLDLNDLLIMPIQRTPRYILLIEELIQFTPETEEIELKKLHEARSIMKDVASFINQSTNNSTLEEIARIQQQLGSKTGNLMQVHRKLIKSGDSVRLVFNSESAIEKRKVNIYLFNDLIIYAINNKFWRKLSLEEVWVRTKTISPEESSRSSHKEYEIFEVYSKSLSCVFLNSSNSNSNSSNSIYWPDLIQKTIDSWVESDKELQQKRNDILKEQQSLNSTFEERQFFFESLSNNNSNAIVDKSKFQVIEEGIVEDRKQKIQNLLVNGFKFGGGAVDNSDNGSGGNSFQNNPIREDGSESGGSETEFYNNSPSNSNNHQSQTSSRNSMNKNNNGKGTFSKRRFQTYRSNSSMSFFNGTSSKLSHIVLTRKDVVLEGYLTKIGEIVKNWKRRWFVMENGYLFYLKTSNSTNVLGRIPLIGSKIDAVSYETKTFSIETKFRTYLFIVDTEKEMKQWLDAINKFHMERESYLESFKQQQQQQQQQQTKSTAINHRLSWLSASRPTLENTQHLKSNTIASFRLSSSLNLKDLSLLDKSEEEEEEEEYDYFEDDSSGSSEEDFPY
ncbi:hypothetical protein CYY_006418 [Polysphondylium violaceum]|uniref:Pleckstrin domain-containing protein n=1 Tax=Polysphondylium violaceum TaxID=133409 RepID=A0A8J4PS71_9MYCE|nr:hypothetical protein CYY_006418 [Polysphondylium violaceum]